MFDRPLCCLSARIYRPINSTALLAQQKYRLANTCFASRPGHQRSKTRSSRIKKGSSELTAEDLAMA